ncbi:tetratricopeptide (TPR) repeat protein/TolB-like protein [Rhodobium orientis]|uniref:Uncharacterized protein n=1 Tax=Rhodobium orientis TaxID=34017 RepID=A0A327JGW3_9HYPH|nr:tetratricopeptide repeat protein [Rhodobium orientis]MBB4305282.1 tetratricopeptide (TPR) repeat protein/TolB-like protein [Rhodobium orientis]MBK5949618.1 hypothetical protein [Rhodobium orientis]RAI25171.1 hypothetical protein CH339_19370 [Rhodobium orientis]
MPPREDAFASALEAVLGSSAFRASPRASAFLRYVVGEEAAGRGDAISAYAIGVDALGKATGFDPQTDPSVRVQAGRVRAQLDEFYRTEGGSLAIRISIPKGGYRPILITKGNGADIAAGPAAVAGNAVNGAEHGAPAGPAATHGAARPLDTDPRFGHLPLKRTDPVLTATVAAILVAVIIGIAGLALHRSWPFSRLVGPDRHIDEPPIVVVHPFDERLEARELKYPAGIRQQLIADLAQFRSIRVRSGRGTAEGDGSEPPPDYVMDGLFFSTDENLHLNLQLTDLHTNTIVWTNTSVFPANDAQFQNYLTRTVRELVSELASPGGLLPREAMERLVERRARLGDEGTTSYACVLRFHQFDLSKRPDDEAAARTCLAEQIAADSRSSSVWAAWAFLRFLDWTNAEASERDAIMSEALAAARRAIRLDPTNALGHEYLGAILAAKGDREAAMDAYRQAMARNPSKPDLYVHLGWAEILQGNWDEGVALIRRGVYMSPAPPGWMRIPLSIAAFRMSDYRTALAEAETVVQSGDQRGLVLALAAAIALGDEDKISYYREAMEQNGGSDPEAAMREIERIFDSPEILKEYKELLSRPARR